MITMDWSYIAAFLDGEGSIGFYKTDGHLYPRIHFNNDCYEVLDIICKFINQGKTKVSKKSGYHWQLQYHKLESCRYILENCLPYLIVKRKEAESAFESINQLFN